jgi:5-methylcytosine-specific restriction enzyme subunit McrC
MPALRPDIVLEEIQTGRIIILDTKFTAQSLVENQWGSQTFDSSHLYQLYAYLRTQENLSENHKSASGILLYPAVNQNKLSEKIELEHHVMRVESVDLSGPWREIEREILDLILKK